MKAIKVHRYDNQASPPKMRERLQFLSLERRLRTKRFSSVLRTNGEWSWHRDRSLAHSLGQRSSWPIAGDTRKTIHQLGQPFSALHQRMEKGKRAREAIENSTPRERIVYIYMRDSSIQSIQSMHQWLRFSIWPFTVKYIALSYLWKCFWFYVPWKLHIYIYTYTHAHTYTHIEDSFMREDNHLKIVKMKFLKEVYYFFIFISYNKDIPYSTNIITTSTVYAH